MLYAICYAQTSNLRKPPTHVTGSALVVLRKALTWFAKALAPRKALTITGCTV